MSTQPSPRIATLVDNMMSAGVPRDEAVAIAAAVEYALDSSNYLGVRNYATLYGTISVDALNTFLDRLSQSSRPDL